MNELDKNNLHKIDASIKQCEFFIEKLIGFLQKEKNKQQIKAITTLILQNHEEIEILLKEKEGIIKKS